jgi:multiple sugar transport system ATP-binding protein
MIFDNLALYPDKTGFQNIANPLLVRKTTPAEIKDQVERLADILQVAHVLHRLPKTMSGGERQRIALGRALIRTPSLFLLDEPLSSLDAKLRIELRAELKRLQREHGYTFLLATPDFNEALAIADQVVMLQHGRVVQIAPPQTLYDLPVDREVARFVGAPQINLVPARFIVEENGSHIEAAGLHIPVPDHLTEVLAPGQTFELGTRPENLQLAPPGQASVGPRTSAKLVDVESLGLKSVLTVEADGQELRLMAESVQTKDLAQGHVVEIEAVETRRLLAFDQETGQRLTSPADSEP